MWIINVAKFSDKRMCERLVREFESSRVSDF